MKVKFIGKVVFNSGRISYEPGKEYEVKEEFAKKFAVMFEVVAAPKVDKPKAEVKPKSKPVQKPKATFKD